MSRVNRRKHVMNEATWDDDELPKENQSIVKVVKSQGNNLHAERQSCHSRSFHFMNIEPDTDPQNAKNLQKIEFRGTHQTNHLNYLDGWSIIITPTGEEYLVSMPTKFRKNIWVKRGSYIVVEPIPEGDKVRAEIVKVLNKNSIKYYKQNNVWPKEFDEEKKENSGDDDLFVNTNRKPVAALSCDNSESEEDDSSEIDSKEGSDTDSSNDSVKHQR